MGKTTFKNYNCLLEPFYGYSTSLNVGKFFVKIVLDILNDLFQANAKPRSYGQIMAFTLHDPIFSQVLGRQWSPCSFVRNVSQYHRESLIKYIK